MKKFSLAVAAFSAIMAAPSASAATFAITGDTSAGIPTFNRPDANGNSAPTRLSSFATSVAYSTFSFAVREADTYNFLLTSTTAGYDPYLILYAGSFNPSSPLTNAVIANDDSGGNLNSYFSRALQTGVVYTAVATGYNNSDIGTFSLLISTDNVLPAVPEPATWAMMLIGFGMVGAAARYRRRGTTVRYA